ncbi:MAG: hypothetical protein ABEJ92_07180 [Halobacteriales archaeon]
MEVQADGEVDADEESLEAYLQDVADGCGCAELWEHLSERRRSD